MNSLLRHELLPFILAAAPALLWTSLVKWFVARRLGQPIPFNPFEREKLKLRMNIGQHIFMGVAAFGVPLAMFDLTDRWLRWKLYCSGSINTLDDLVGAIAIGFIAGMLWGFRSASSERAE